MAKPYRSINDEINPKRIILLKKPQMTWEHKSLTMPSANLISGNEVAEEDPSICLDLRRFYCFPSWPEAAETGLEGGKEDGSGTVDC